MEICILLKENCTLKEFNILRERLNKFKSQCDIGDVVFTHIDVKDNSIGGALIYYVNYVDIAEYNILLNNNREIIERISVNEKRSAIKQSASR